jgi:Response regulator of the LytR/AlgR family
MKITGQESEKCKEIEVRILCRRNDEKVKEIIDSLQRNSCKVNVQNEKMQTFLLPSEQILYIESVEKKVFVYGMDEIYDCKYKLYQLEEMLPYSLFFRISKSVILNVLAVQCLEPEEGRRLKVTLENGERLIVSRQYVNDIKLRLGIKQEALK